MSNTKGWGIEEEKEEYRLDDMVLSGAISEGEAQGRLPGYNAPGHYNCSCPNIKEQERAAQERAREEEERRNTMTTYCP